jgi:pyrroloquinoline quinone (PQQ) biosynthesis protein C
MHLAVAADFYRIKLRMMSSSTALSVGFIEARIATLRDQLSKHPLYSNISKPEHLRLFMESHVFAVWDFMSLLKTLQRALTCMDLPWVPTPYSASRRFINSIVLGEESDEYEGRPMSHFEIYLEAMERAGANTEAIRRVVERAPQGIDLEAVPVAARRFVQTTFRVIRKGSLPAQAAAFTFGREDAIPSMFQTLVRGLNRELGGDLAQFVWYMERHVELDGDEHGPLSLRMVSELCGNDAALWEEAAQAAEDAIQARLDFWDGILEEIQQTEVAA